MKIFSIFSIFNKFFKCVNFVLFTKKTVDTQERNVRTSELLHMAKYFLKKNEIDRSTASVCKSKYICLAIAEARKHYDALGVKNTVTVEERIVNEILDRLGTSTMYGFLNHKGIPSEQITNNLLQKHRHDWLDLLIAEYQAKGD